MSWNKNFPLSSTRVKLFPATQQDNNDALEGVLETEHTFPGTYGSTAGKHSSGMTFWDYLYWYDTATDDQFRLVMDDNLISFQGVYGGSWTTIMSFARTPALPTINFLILESGWAYMRSGTKMLFPQRYLPNNWSAPASPNDDKLLRVVDSSGTGGASSGSWTPSGLTCDSGGIGPHTHTFSDETSEADADDVLGDDGGLFAAGIAHSHTFSGTTPSGSDSHTHSLTFSSAWRPEYVNVLEGVKD